MPRVLVAVVLVAVFLRQVVVAGVTTAWLILRPGERPHPRLVPYFYDDLSPMGAAVLACLVTLTPGTTAIDVNPDRQRLVLHLLDGRDPDSVVDDIRLRFETRLRGIFPGGPA